MEIRLYKPHAFLDSHIDQAAAAAGCIARFKWHMPTGARFVLVDRPTSDLPASFEQHDEVIRQLLTVHPQARIRTAMATYDGLTDFEAQFSARVA